MPVFVTHNYDVSGGVVNGMRGILKSVNYETGPDGSRYATSCVISSDSVDCAPLPHLIEHEIVALRETTSFSIRLPTTGKNVTIQRSQLPVFPAFAMTDYKAQGKTMPLVVVDLESCRSRQSAYVMLSRATSMESLLVLRPFKRSRLTTDFSEDLKKETMRLKSLSNITICKFKASVDWPPNRSGESSINPRIHSNAPSVDPLALSDVSANGGTNLNLTETRSSIPPSIPPSTSESDSTSYVSSSLASPFSTHVSGATRGGFDSVSVLPYTSGPETSFPLQEPIQPVSGR